MLQQVSHKIHQSNSENWSFSLILDCILKKKKNRSKPKKQQQKWATRDKYRGSFVKNKYQVPQYYGCHKNTTQQLEFMSYCVRLCMCTHNSLLNQMHDLKSKQKLCKSLDVKGNEASENNA